MHLLDVNVWLALAFKRHVQHAPAVRWLRAAAGRCIFCRLTQAGFLRLATNPSAMGPAAVAMTDAWRAYDAFLADPNVAFADEPGGVETLWRANTQQAIFSPKVWNDAYLAAFAQAADFEVVSFDRGFAQFPNLRHVILE